jgi:hypothetical protein
MSIKYCCERFRESFGTGDGRGLCIVLKQNARIGSAFILQFRAVARDQEAIPWDSGDVILMRRVEQAIQYCPWCGCKLAQRYRNELKLLPVAEDDVVSQEPTQDEEC